MNNEKIYEITILKDEYDNLKLGEYILNDITSLMAEALENAELSWNNRSLSFNSDDINHMFKMYCTSYNKRIEELKERGKINE